MDATQQTQRIVIFLNMQVFKTLTLETILICILSCEPSSNHIWGHLMLNTGYGGYSTRIIVVVVQHRFLFVLMRKNIVPIPYQDMGL